MHFLTAFVVTGVAVGLMRSLFAARRNGGAWVLAIVLTLQVALGVEAWMGKFGSGILPELEAITKLQAGIRTAHLLVGSVLLGTAVVLAVAGGMQRESA